MGELALRGLDEPYVGADQQLANNRPYSSSQRGNARKRCCYLLSNIQSRKLPKPSGRTCTGMAEGSDTIHRHR